MTHRRIRIDQIVFDAGTQIRAAISEKVVGEYADLMTEGVAFPPVVLFHDGNHYYMADGFHRGLASKRNAFVDIDSEIHAGTKTDALWFALGANRANGHRMTEADKKHAIGLAIVCWPDRPAGEIASQIGCSRSWVSETRAKQDSATGNLTRVTGKDGKRYPASRQMRKADVPSEPSTEVAPKFKSRAAVQQRRERMQTMATEGYTTRQIAAAIGVSEDGCRETLRRAGIEVPADHVVGNSKHHNADRIVERMVMDAEHLCADVNLINFANLDRARLTTWLESLKQSREHLGGFIRRLMKEQQKNVEAA